MGLSWLFSQIYCRALLADARRHLSGGVSDCQARTYQHRAANRKKEIQIDGEV
jgi:hypothetical protein